MLKLERLKLGDYKICENKISCLDIYAPSQKNGLNIIQIITGPKDLMKPIILPGNVLLERNEFFGMNNDYLPRGLLNNVFVSVFKSFYGEDREHNWRLRLFYASETEAELQLDFNKKIVLDLTRELRDHVPKEILSNLFVY